MMICFLLDSQISSKDYHKMISEHKVDPQFREEPFRCAGCSLHQFGEVQAHRTFSNYILTEIARYIDLFHTSSGWFDWTEPSLTTSLQGL